MPFYTSQGNIPPKRHTQFRKPDGTLFHEQLFGTVGFDGMSSLLYHHTPPTLVRDILSERDVAPKVAMKHSMYMKSFDGFRAPSTEDFLESRIPVLTNEDCTLSLSAPTNLKEDYFYKNVDSDEVIFIHEGSGTLKTLLGDIRFEYGDYLVIPRGIIFTMEFDSPNNRHFIIESRPPVYTPKRYRNHFGQLLEHSPFCERDIRTPILQAPIVKQGEHILNIKKQNVLYEYVYDTHPFDVEGWDGYHFPYAFSIHQFEPITGRVHQPPPVHQTFETSAFVICSFCPRLYDYHPLSIPAPYNHSNIDSDEVLYYVDGDFMSRNDIKKGQITLHPAGIPHGPHPGAYERSIGKTKTDELAVMVDTFRPLQLTEQALNLEIDGYYTSWLHQ